uniref:Uncharacterized protein n=1 Tax=Takifugu rubripes TaxID=31033 RepID=A0A674PIT7_TAKRU
CWCDTRARVCRYQGSCSSFPPVCFFPQKRRSSAIIRGSLVSSLRKPSRRSAWLHGAEVDDNFTSNSGGCLLLLMVGVCFIHHARVWESYDFRKKQGSRELTCCGGPSMEHTEGLI